VNSLDHLLNHLVMRYASQQGLDTQLTVKQIRALVDGGHNTRAELIRIVKGLLAERAI
jgi:hypothetical protein